jgi:preprotein translocase subunit SecB
VNVDLQTSGKPLAADVYEVVLSVTVTVKLGEKIAYLIEVHQAGVFSASGFAEDELGQLLGSYCPGILFPYAREAVSAMVSKGGFPQFLLTPVNFDIMYAQHKQKLAAQAASDAPLH